MVINVIILFDFDELLHEVPRALTLGLAYNKYRYSFILLILIPTYIFICGFYGTNFLQFLCKRVCTVFTLSAYFCTVILILFWSIFIPNIEIFTVFTWVYDRIPNFYALTSLFLLCLDGRTLMHREGFYFENWKFFTFMHLQMYLFGYLLGFCTFNVFFTFFWVFIPN